MFQRSQDGIYGQEYQYEVSYSGSDVAVMVNGSPRDYVGEMNPTASICKNHWDHFYKQISNAATMVTRADAMDASAEDKDEIKATGYFFLGYWYYRLITTFGNVPLKLEEDTKPKYDYQTSTVARILGVMIPKLEFAVKHLPDMTTADKVSKAAGYMLLSKYYLMNGQFEDAANAATAVIETPGRALMKERFGALVGENNPKIPNPNVMTDLFYKYNAGNPANTEAIYVVFDYPGLDGGLSSGSERMREYLVEWYKGQGTDSKGDSPYGTGSGDRTTIDGGTGGFGPLGEAADLQILWTGRGIGGQKKTHYFSNKIWAGDDFKNDMRHTAPNWYPMEFLLCNAPGMSGRGNLKKENCSDTLRNWDCIQYNKVVVDDENRLETNYNMLGGSMNQYVYRLAEAYLIRAEAYTWQDKGDLAAADINEIRTRAGALPMSGNATLEDVLDERARELMLEEFRRSELVRIAYTMAKTGKDGYSIENIGIDNWFYDRMKKTNNLYFDVDTPGYPDRNFEYKGKIYRMSPYHIYYAIPESAINDNKLARINQNYGYVGYENNVTPLE